MALVTELKKGFKSGGYIHGVTECNYYIVSDKKGNNYLQIETFGSSDREIPGKVSQSIQFSPEAIRQLRDILSQI